MHAPIGFRGIPGHLAPTVLAITAEGERPVAHPAGVRVEWGHMGESVTRLARALAREIYGQDDSEAAEHIKRHFLTSFRRQDAWALETADVQAYVAQRRQVARFLDRSAAA